MSAPVIGILGGIGSGKSSVIRKITDRNLTIIDADVIGHDVLKSPNIIAQLTTAFGNDILVDKPTETSNISETPAPKAIDRQKLSKLVFGDHSQQKHNLETLNGIVHPEIRRRLHQEIDSAKKSSDAVILDASLLLEGNWDAHCDHLIFIDTDIQIRQARVQKNRGWDASELPKREKTQVKIATKRQQADFTVDNSGNLEKSAHQMKQILKRIIGQSLSEK